MTTHEKIAETNEHKRAPAAEVDPDGMFERAYAEAAGVAHETATPRIPAMQETTDMTTREKALEAAQEEFAAQMGDTGTDRVPSKALNLAIAAYFAALLPEDSAGLVDALTRAQAKADDNELPAIKALFQRSASLIQSQAARIAELEAALEVAAGRLVWAAQAKPGIRDDVGKQMVMDWATEARSLLNGERKG